MVSDRNEVSLLRQRIAELETQVQYLELTREEQTEIIRKLQVRLYLNKIPHNVSEDE